MQGICPGTAVRACDHGPMPGCGCDPDYDALFDDRSARRDLATYRRKGATGNSRLLVDAIRSAGVSGAAVLDIGAGIGVVGTELLVAGASHLTDVDAARAYVAAARSEVERRGFAERATFIHGDFVALADQVEPADVVTLDRVLCCYGDWQSLVDRSAERSRRLYGLVYPSEHWWMRIVIGGANLGMRLFRRRFRVYLHPERAVDARIRGHGFLSIARERGLAWQTALYARSS